MGKSPSASLNKSNTPPPSGAVLAQLPNEAHHDGKVRDYLAGILG